MYHINLYPRPVGLRVSHSGDQDNRVNSLKNGSIMEMKETMVWLQHRKEADRD